MEPLLATLLPPALRQLVFDTDVAAADTLLELPLLYRVNADVLVAALLLFLLLLLLFLEAFLLGFLLQALFLELLPIANLASVGSPTVSVVCGRRRRRARGTMSMRDQVL